MPIFDTPCVQARGMVGHGGQDRAKDAFGSVQRVRLEMVEGQLGGVIQAQLDFVVWHGQ